MKGNLNLTKRAQRDGAEDTLFTPPAAVMALLTVEHFAGVGWDPASGSGNISKCFKPQLLSSDISTAEWVYGRRGVDFLQCRKDVDFIITNPPYVLATTFAEHALECADKVALLLRLQFLESRKRYQFFKDHPPAVIYIPTGRIKCYSPTYQGNGAGINSQSLAWFVWKKRHKGAPVIKWLPYP